MLQGCFIFHFTSIHLKVAWSTQPIMCTKTIKKYYFIILTRCSHSTAIQGPSKLSLNGFVTSFWGIKLSTSIFTAVRLIFHQQYFILCKNNFINNISFFIIIICNIYIAPYSARSYSKALYNVIYNIIISAISQITNFVMEILSKHSQFGLKYQQ